MIVRAHCTQRCIGEEQSIQLYVNVVVTFDLNIPNLNWEINLNEHRDLLRFATHFRMLMRKYNNRDRVGGIYE